MIELALATATSPSVLSLSGALLAVLGVGVISICIAMGACTYRLIQGPTIADRVVALDLLASFIVGAIALYAMQSGRFEIVSVAIVMALMLFVGTAAFALYLEKGVRRP